MSLWSTGLTHFCLIWTLIETTHAFPDSASPSSVYIRRSGMTARLCLIWSNQSYLLVNRDLLRTNSLLQAPFLYDHRLMTSNLSVRKTLWDLEFALFLYLSLYSKRFNCNLSLSVFSLFYDPQPHRCPIPALLSRNQFKLHTDPELSWYWTLYVWYLSRRYRFRPNSRSSSNSDSWSHYMRPWKRLPSAMFNCVVHEITENS